jgi:hypothetical protein
MSNTRGKSTSGVSHTRAGYEWRLASVPQPLNIEVAGVAYILFSCSSASPNSQTVKPYGHQSVKNLTSYADAV